jgi:hypothetical protein
MRRWLTQASLVRRWFAVALAIAALVGLVWLVVVAAPGWFVADRSLEGLKA